MGIVTTGIMSNPSVTTRVNVRGLRMSLHVAVIANLFRRSSLLRRSLTLLHGSLTLCRGRRLTRRRSRTRMRGWPTSRNVSAYRHRARNVFFAPPLFCANAGTDIDKNTSRNTVRVFILISLILFYDLAKVLHPLDSPLRHHTIG